MRAREIPGLLFDKIVQKKRLRSCDADWGQAGIWRVAIIKRCRVLLGYNTVKTVVGITSCFKVWDYDLRANALSFDDFLMEIIGGPFYGQEWKLGMGKILVESVRLRYGPSFSSGVMFEDPVVGLIASITKTADALMRADPVASIKVWEREFFPDASFSEKN